MKPLDEHDCGKRQKGEKPTFADGAIVPAVGFDFAAVESHQAPAEPDIAEPSIALGVDACLAFLASGDRSHKAIVARFLALCKIRQHPVYTEHGSVRKMSEAHGVSHTIVNTARRTGPYKFNEAYQLTLSTHSQRKAD